MLRIPYPEGSDRPPMTSTVNDHPAIVSLGCRLNAAESEVMRARAVVAGLGPTVIVNTCAVTAEAERQARQAIRRARRDHPQARILVTGCAAQISPQQFARMPEVDHVIGNREKLAAETFERLGPRSPRVMVADIMADRSSETGLAASFSSRGRALAAIQSGCDHRCTFCVIPYGRGPSRSVPPLEVVTDVRRLVASGVREVVLTGVDITSWGNDLDGQPRLGDLVRAVLAGVPELARLRLSSIDQAEIDDALIAAFADEQRLMPHVHLSLQHGSDLILKRMKRRHSRRRAVDLCGELRRLRPDMAFGADLIAGFPTETEEQFRETLTIIDDCGIVQVHAFPYSARVGTPAARMPQVAPAALKDRTTRLVEKSRSVLSRWLASHTGKPVAAILEGSGPRDGRARTPQFAPVTVAGLPAGLELGDVVTAIVSSHNGQRLVAEAQT